MDSLMPPSQIVIAAGGKGTRISSEFGTIPKALIPVGGVPVLTRILELARSQNIEKALLLVHYQSVEIEEHFGDGSAFGITIEYAYEKQALGNGGALVNSYAQLEDIFYYLYGDLVIDVDLRAMARFHNNRKAELTMFVHPNDHPHDSDLVGATTEGRVTQLFGYPHGGQDIQNLVNAALYVVSKNFVANLPLEKLDFAKDAVPLGLQSKRKIWAYKSREYVKDMGTPERKQKVERHLASGLVSARRISNPIPAVFLDRDGTVIHEKDLLSSPSDIELFDGVADAIRKINESGALAIMVTNQSVIARGLCTEQELQMIHNRMETLLGKEGAYLDEIYYCPHHPDSGYDGEVSHLKIKCDCRKPSTGMIDTAVATYNIDLSRSWLIGDTTTDIKAAKLAGIKSLLVETGYGGKDAKWEVEPDTRAPSLIDAIRIIDMDEMAT
jgi:histidinol-phosphate phosphatase family protein